MGEIIAFYESSVSLDGAPGASRFNATARLCSRVCTISEGQGHFTFSSDVVFVRPLIDTGL